MMTITIAAITIGIAVDNSIHYIYRFKEEFKNFNNYNKTLDRCHNTVGIAILNTSITIVFGFSILVLSNFIPTIYFGVFTHSNVVSNDISAYFIAKVNTNLQTLVKINSLIMTEIKNFLSVVNLFVLNLIILIYFVIQCFVRFFPKFDFIYEMDSFTIITIISVPKLNHT